MSETKIIIYQDGKSLWWPWAFQSLRDWCKAPVLFITNQENALSAFSDLFTGCTFYNIDNYRHHTEPFRKRYFERWDSRSWFVGFERFIILCAFIAEQRIERFFTFDSDFLLFCDPLAEVNKFEKYDFTLSMGCGTHDMFWNNAPALADFVMYCGELMDRDIELSEGEKTVGSFSDMHALMMFKEERSYNIGEMTDIRLGVTWDNNLKQDYHHWEYLKTPKGDRKKMVFIEGRPYCYNTLLKMRARFAGLHVSSYLKVQIPEIYREARCSLSDAGKT